MQATIVARWDNSGKSELDEYIEELTNQDIISIDGHFVQELIWERREELTERYPQINPDEHIQLREAVWPLRHYFLYYAYHPHSGYYTEFEAGKDEEGEYVRPVVKQSEGAHFCAFWSEVVILRVD